MKTEVKLQLSPNTMKWAEEMSKRQGISIELFLTTIIDTQCFVDYVEGKFEPLKKGKK